MVQKSDHNRGPRAYDHPGRSLADDPVGHLEDLAAVAASYHLGKDETVHAVENVTIGSRLVFGLSRVALEGSLVFAALDLWGLLGEDRERVATECRLYGFGHSWFP